jgi:hypothetical protein
MQLIPVRPLPLTEWEEGMSNDWMEIYRDYEPVELDAEIAKLKQEATVYTAQNIGDKGYQKSLEMVQNRLHAAIRVRNERRQTQNPSWGVPDFSHL